MDAESSLQQYRTVLANLMNAPSPINADEDMALLGMLEQKMKPKVEGVPAPVEGDPATAPDPALPKTVLEALFRKFLGATIRATCATTAAMQIERVAQIAERTAAQVEKTTRQAGILFAPLWMLLVAAAVPAVLAWCKIEAVVIAISLLLPIGALVIIGVITLAAARRGELFLFGTQGSRSYLVIIGRSETAKRLIAP